MNVPGKFYVNEHLQKLMFEELEQYVSHGDVGGFSPAVKQLANVAALPGKVQFRGKKCSLLVAAEGAQGPRFGANSRVSTGPLHRQASSGAPSGCRTSTRATDSQSATSPPST